MRHLILLSALFTLFSLKSFAQTEVGTLPSRAAKDGEFTEWKKVEFNNGSETLTYEYRIAFVKRKALACYYTIEVRNTSSKKITVKVNTHYFDKLVKSNFGDEYKATMKPGKVAGYDVITQGARGDKEKKDQPDVERCLDCDFSYSLTATAE